MFIPRFIKNIAYILLPDAILQSLRVFHYSRQFKGFDPKAISEYDIVSKLIPSGSTVIDIGANIGLFSKCFSFIVGAEGKVYSLEPVPQTYKVLFSNSKLLKFGNVIPMNYAASDVETTVTMVIPTYQSRHGIDAQGNVYEGRGENYYEAKIISGNDAYSDKQVQAKTKTIDSLFLDISKNISFIKCDVEGHELQCILGSLSIIQRDMPAMLIEVMDNPEQNTSPAFRLFKILRETGYTPFYLKDGFLMPVEGSNNEINFFFLSPHHIQLLGSIIG